MKVQKIICLLFILCLLNSCSVATSFFIQNFLQKDVDVTIAYNIPVQELSKHGNYRIAFLNQIISPKDFSKSADVKEIEAKQINDSTLIIKIPPNSTVRIAGTANMYFKKYINHISINDKKKSIDALISESDKKKGTFTYKIETTK